MWPTPPPGRYRVAMDLPDDYLDVLTDELAPFGLEFDAAESTADGEWQIRFETEPESFVHRYPWTGIDASYGSSWPPEVLSLWIKGEGSDVVEITFEIYDLLLWAQAEAHDLAGRLGSLDDPYDQAAAVSEALSELLSQPEWKFDNLG